ncbi:sensor histidine kinase [Streptosporangium pseudovulgare]|uniref:histidine kinase n=1 Tax=Streptosporangium pseudovulgare TaxID=35765 RepID=A0ABQ2RAL6_9ACTN|nr:sensor histidine kinase [Streptosporangium pseudovulgare]GGQ22329.1 ATPase [Streptosporangium pseudovulgare]
MTAAQPHAAGERDVMSGSRVTLGRPWIDRWARLLDSPAADGVLALALVAGTWGWEVFEPGRGRPTDVLSLTLTALVNAPLAMRRREPFTLLVVSVSASLVYHALGYHPGLNGIGPLLALYSVAVRCAWQATAAGTVLVVTEWTHASNLQPGAALWSALGQALIVAAWAVITGSVVRLLGERGRQLAALAVRLAEEQEVTAQRAVTHERVRIARELHDVVAHHMSVISIQAGLGRYVALSDPATAHAALGVIADTSHEALTEMRRLLSILRIEAHEDDEGGHPAMPGLGQLDILVERMRTAGQTIQVDVEGRPRTVPPGLDLCAYRIVQESLTNVLKHAGPAQVRIRLTYTRDALTLHITDDGGNPGAPAASSAGPGCGGDGLIGMTERVRLYQGTIIAHPLAQGGFEVLVMFPLPPSDLDAPI